MHPYLITHGAKLVGVVLGHSVIGHEPESQLPTSYQHCRQERYECMSAQFQHTLNHIIVIDGHLCMVASDGCDALKLHTKSIRGTQAQHSHHTLCPFWQSHTGLYLCSARFKSIQTGTQAPGLAM